jgi:CheY-like chemotaxis protein
MNDQAAKLFAAHAGVCAVLVDMLIDKGIISQGEACDRFKRAQSAVGHWAGGRAAARELADIVAYLKPDEPGTPLLDRAALVGETVLVVESDASAAEALQLALEHAGAEVLIARTAVEALPRIAQFDFSAAVVEWRLDTREHRTLIRWLREDGVRFLYRAEVLPEAKATASSLPVLLKSAPQHEVVAQLVRLTAAVGDNVGAA